MGQGFRSEPGMGTSLFHLKDRKLRLEKVEPRRLIASKILTFDF